ncbi:MAG: MFS transporter [Streptosporangiaceae bacterium]|nr:MFS transporter [Streptosporangiaceae bacterium]
MRQITLERVRTGPEPADVGFGGRFMFATSFGAVLNPINSSIIAIALVAIGHSMHVGTATTIWLVSALYLATSVGQPTMGKLADQMGARRVYLGGLALVALGGVLGLPWASLTPLIAARIIIGLGTSAAYPAAVALIRRQSERLSQRTPGRVLGALATAGQVTMAVGPLLGGFLLTVGGWRSIFLINIPLAGLGAAFVLVWLPHDEPIAVERGNGTPDQPAAWRRIDPVGLVVFAAGLTMLLLFLMNPTRPNWYYLGAAVALLFALTAWERRWPTPFIDVRMLVANRALTFTYIRYAMAFVGIYGIIYGWTQWLEQSAGRSASAAGLLLTPAFVVAAVLSMLGSRNRAVFTPLVVGTVAMILGALFLLILNSRSATWELLVANILFGVPTGLNVVGNQSAMYAQTPAAHIGTASGLLRTAGYLGAILSTSLISATFGQRATDSGLHGFAIVLTVLSALMLVLTVADPSVRPRRQTDPKGAPVTVANRARERQ